MRRIIFYALFGLGLAVLLFGFVLGCLPGVTHEFSLRLMWLGIGLMVAGAPVLVSWTIYLDSHFEGQPLLPYDIDDPAAGEPGNGELPGDDPDDDEEPPWGPVTGPPFEGGDDDDRPKGKNP